MTAASTSPASADDRPAVPLLPAANEWTVYHAAELQGVLHGAFTALPAGADMAIDLAGVTDMDSAGVQLLLSARKTAAASGRGLRLLQPSAAVQDVLRALGLEHELADATAGATA